MASIAFGSMIKWRICFRWSDGEVWDVEIADYH